MFSAAPAANAAAVREIAPTCRNMLADPGWYVRLLSARLCVDMAVSALDRAALCGARASAHPPALTLWHRKNTPPGVARSLECGRLGEGGRGAVFCTLIPPKAGISLSLNGLQACVAFLADRQSGDAIGIKHRFHHQ